MDEATSNGAVATAAQSRPGALTTRRPRHDNDRSNITGIHIMPTYGEVTSGADAYLPTADPDLWTLSGTSGRFDREFRLLREDTAGQIRDTCREVLEAVRGPGIDAYRRQRTSTHFDFCDDAKIQHITISKKHGIEFTVAFKQPESTRSMTNEQRQTWWQRCKRFRPGTVVCVLDRAGVILHFVVSESTLRRPEDAPDDFLMNKYKFNLSSGNELSYVILKLVESSKVGDALRWYRDTERMRYLLDFPDLMLAAFKDTLEALQRQCLSPNRLIDLLNPLHRPAVERPAYARAPGFEFNLDCLMQNGQAFPRHIRNPAEMSSFLDLGPDQVRALLQSLHSEVALIHGRPGTGKSYLAWKIIKVLIHNRENAGIGPVVCIFHSDAALDRMAGQLLDDGIEGIVRMGGRSDSERLRRLDLPATRHTRMSREERHAEKQTARLRDKLVSNIDRQLQQLSEVDSIWQLDKFLTRKYPDSHKEVFGSRHGDFSDYQPSQSNAFCEWLNGVSSFEDDLPALGNWDELRASQRRDQHQIWMEEMRDHNIEELMRRYEEFEEVQSELSRFHDDARRQILQDSQVVAVTTSELARYPELLQRIEAKVLICDDAGEFLEAQTLTAILPSTEHIILIGGKQLLPKVHTQRLQRTSLEGTPLDVSLFERLLDMTYDLCPRVPRSTLPVQRRMRPSIAWLNRLVRDTGFGNDARVETFPEVVGMRPPLFWLDHRHMAGRAGLIQKEDFSLDDFEIEMVTAMLIHLVRQGHYMKHEIAVVTPSLSPLRQLLRRLETENSFTTRVDHCDLEGILEMNPKELQEHDGYSGSVSNGRDRCNAGVASLGSVRLATLDSFRGQEAKVVIIPLGRCTSQRALHSMRTSNRIDVLMSRAQHGSYILGDSTAYKEDPVWRRIIDTLESGGNLGDTLELKCPRHPGEVIRVSSPDEFNLASPDGGCSQPCGGQLDCGHDCCCSCHSNVMHKVTQCGEPCPRSKPRCGHACPLTCGESCQESCSKVMNDVDLKLACGHIIQSPRCWQVQDPAGVACEAEVEYKVPGCDHEVTVPCYKTGSQNPSFRCPATCGAALPCGHVCQRKCHECNFRYRDTFLEAVHNLCDQPCGKSQPDCVHSCQRTCHRDACGPCQQPCDVHCSHGKCEKLCSEPCLPCTEDCASGCPHSNCTMPCAAPCNWVPCSRRCANLLECGHQCPSLCGEICPDSMYCQICATEDILFTVVGFDMKDYRDIDLDKDPCIFPHCGHFQTKSSMDQQLGLQDFYNSEEEGSLSSIKSIQSPFSTQKIPCCTQCRGSLRDISRYGRIIRRPMLDELLKELIISSHGKFSELAGHLAQHVSSLTSNTDYRYIPTSSDQQSLSIKLEGNMESQIDILIDFVGEGRYVYADLASLYRDIQTFSRELSAKEAVFQKVADLTRRANGNNNAGARATTSIHLHEPFVQPCGNLVAMNLSLRCNIAILTDFLRLWKEKITPGIDEHPALQFDMTSNFRCCRKLIQQARETKRPLLEAQGHVYFAWFCGFAIVSGFEVKVQREEDLPASTRLSETAMPDPATNRDLMRRGIRNISKASAILAGCPLNSWYLRDEIAAIKRFVRQGFLEGEPAADWHTAMAKTLVSTGPWYACDNGHAFTDSRADPMFLGQLRCRECGLIVTAHEQVSEEGQTYDGNGCLPSQGEMLVDI